jgi:hypothetical protein
VDSLNYNEKNLNTGFYYHPGHIWPLKVKGLTKISFLGEQKLKKNNKKSFSSGQHLKINFIHSF